MLQCVIDTQTYWQYRQCSAANRKRPFTLWFFCCTKWLYTANNSCWKLECGVHFIFVVLSLTAYSCCSVFVRTNVTFHVPNYSGECGQLDFVFLSSTGHQYHSPIRYFCSVCYFTSEAENLCYHYLLWPARGYWTRPLELICFSHRGSVSWLESAPNSSHAIACSGVDLFPYLRKIKQSSMLGLLLNISSWRFSFMRNPFFHLLPHTSGHSVSSSLAALKVWSCQPRHEFQLRTSIFFSPPSPRVIKLWTGQVSPTHSWVFIMASSPCSLSCLITGQRTNYQRQKELFFFSRFTALCPPRQTRQAPHTLSFEVSLY